MEEREQGRGEGNRRRGESRKERRKEWIEERSDKERMCKKNGGEEQGRWKKGMRKGGEKGRVGVGKG